MARPRSRYPLAFDRQSPYATHVGVPPGATLAVRRLNWRLAQPVLLALVIVVPLGIWVVHKGEPRLALQAFTRVGWGLLAVVLVRIATVVMCGTAWSRLLRRLSMPLRLFQAVRFIREGLNVLLPSAAVGGDILGMRLITFWGLSGALAIASVTVDVMLQALAQTVFTLLGVALLVRAYGVGSPEILMLGGVVVFVAALLAFQVLQRRGMKPLERLLERVLPRNPLCDGDPRSRGAATLGLHAAFTEIWSDRPGIGAASGLHLAAWLVGILEIWIALRCMGHSRGWEVAATLESLSQGLRSLVFPVPAGIGVQEGSLIVLGQMLGLQPGAALAISMVKRVPDLVLGAPALLAWVGLEARHAIHGRPKQGGDGGDEHQRR